MIRAITNLADQAVVMPLSFIVFLVLFITWRQASYAWMLGILVTFATIIIAKIIGYVVIGHWPFDIGLRSPSGHAAAGAIVYGTLLALIIGRGHNTTIIACIASFLIAIMFSITRLDLEVHTKSEVLVGSAIGILGAFTIGKLVQPITSYNPIPLVIASGFAIWAQYGKILYGERIIAHIALTVRSTLKGCFKL